MCEQQLCTSVCLITADSMEPGRGEGTWPRKFFYNTDQPPAIFKQLGTTWPAASTRRSHTLDLDHYHLTIHHLCGSGHSPEKRMKKIHQ